jgi:hypothetical protein
MAKVRTGDARSPDQRTVDGIREFYLGFLSRCLPMEAFDRVRHASVTEMAMKMLQGIREEIASSGVITSSEGEQKGGA